MALTTVDARTPGSTATYIQGPEFFELVRTYLGPEDLERVEEAYEVARQQHGEQRRKSGEYFFTHPLTVAYYLATYRLDAPALMGALLHDVAEDARLTIAQIEERIDKIIWQRIDDGQFDQCPLTFKDISIVKETFVRVLRGIQHNRIEYQQNIMRDLGRKLQTVKTDAKPDPGKIDALLKEIQKPAGSASNE